MLLGASTLLFRIGLRKRPLADSTPPACPSCQKGDCVASPFLESDRHAVLVSLVERGLSRNLQLTRTAVDVVLSHSHERARSDSRWFGHPRMDHPLFQVTLK